ncbi:MAG TPA: molybdopterin cofactor-binding domain-containing protein [Actinocrinis sp.]|nr:molybdopterin cofactor-binding domain-containing protein [Actinocrinis sp.]
MSDQSRATSGTLPAFLIGEQLPEPTPGREARPVETAAPFEAGDGFGRAVPAAKAAGHFPFADDLSVPGLLWAGLARSPYPDAHLVKADTRMAAAIPGVHAVLAGPDLGVERVDHVGQCVAVVAAEHPALVRAALAAIIFDYQVGRPGGSGEPLTDPMLALTAPPIHPDGNVAARRRFLFGGSRPSAPAPVIVEFDYHFAAPPGRLVPGVILAVPDGGRLLLHTVSNDPVADRRALAEALGRPEESFQLNLLPRNTGPGNRLGDDPDARAAAALLALRTGRPVKVVDTPESGHGPAAPDEAERTVVFIKATHGSDEEGKLLAVRIDAVIDGGTDPDAAERLLDEYCRLAVGPYRSPVVEIQGRVVRTHNPPLPPWPEGAALLAAAVTEAQFDALAARTEKTSLDVRVKNLIRAGDLLPDGRRVAAPVPGGELIAALLDSEMPSFPPGPDVREFPGSVGRTGELSRLRRGVGVALAMIDLVPPNLPEEHAVAQLALTADVHGPIAHVTSTLIDTGTGEHALLRRIVREALGVRRVLVRHPADPAALSARIGGAGMDDHGRAAWLHGMAVQRAARGVRTQAFAGLARQLAISPELLEVRGGKVVTYDGVLSRSVDDVYAIALRGAVVFMAEGEFRVRGGGPAEPGTFVPEEGEAYLAIAAHRAVVDADTELGLLRPVHVTAAHDAGRALVPGRATAAVEAGITAAVRTACFGDRTASAPSAMDLPTVEVCELIESSIGDLATTALRRRGFSAPLPLGYKPLGRVAHAAAAAALACAARDALAVHHTTLPIRPWSY